MTGGSAEFKEDHLSCLICKLDYTEMRAMSVMPGYKGYFRKPPMTFLLSKQSQKINVLALNWITLKWPFLTFKFKS